MGQMKSLHIQDTNFEEVPTGGRFVPAIITAAIVLVAGGALMLLTSDAPTRSVPESSATSADGAPIAGEPGIAGESATLPAPSDAAAAPVFTTVSVPAGTTLSLEIVEPATSFDAEVGTRVVATLTSAVIVESEVALESGSLLIGRVSETTETTAANESPVAAIEFEAVEFDGKTTLIVAELKGEHLDLAPGRRLELQLEQAVSVPIEDHG